MVLAGGAGRGIQAGEDRWLMSLISNKHREPWDRKAWRRQILEPVAQIMQMDGGDEFLDLALSTFAREVLEDVRDGKVDAPEYAACARIVRPDFENDDE
jgi:hypothetical protein